MTQGGINGQTRSEELRRAAAALGREMNGVEMAMRLLLAVAGALGRRVVTQLVDQPALLRDHEQQWNKQAAKQPRPLQALVANDAAHLRELGRSRVRLWHRVAA